MHTLDLLSSWFISATVRGSLLALAVLALQAALRGRMPAHWRYALWLPVVFVLISPGLPESRWSLENHFVPTNIRAEQPARDVASPVALDSAPPPMPAEPASAPHADWRRFAQVGWLVGAACMLAFAFAAYARTLRRVFQHAMPTEPALTAMLGEAALAAGVRRAPRLVVSAAVQSPAVCGFLRPVLLLPAGFPGAFTREEARLVLLHELMHLKRHDLPLNWLLCLLQALHWCNPILWFAFARIRADREAACDAQVLAATAADSRADYGHALLKLEGSLARPGLSLGFVGIFERAAGVGSRIRAIAAYRRTHPAWGMLGAGLIAALTLVGATRAQRPVEGNAPDPSAPTAEIRRKLETIIIPRLEFRDASLREALDFLRKKSVDLDTNEPDPAKRGVNIVLNLNAPRNLAQAPGAPVAPGMSPTDARLTISLTNVPLIEALHYVTALANLKFRIEPRAVEVVPLDALERLLTREWKVSPEAGFVAGKNPKALLETRGVSFPTGATAALSSDGRRLVMKNSQENLDRVDALLASSGAREQAAPSDGTKAINHKLSTIVIPRLEFRDATLREALEFLKKKSVDLDTTEPDPTKRGVNIVLKLAPQDDAPPAVEAIPGLDAVPVQPANRDFDETRLNLSLTNVPLGEALKYVTDLANVKFKVEPYAVAIVPLTTPAAR